MAESAPEDRTQAPTEARLRRARDEGQAPLSRELVSLAGLAAATLMFAVAGPGLLRMLGAHLQAALADTTLTPVGALHEAGLALMLAVGPLSLVIMVSAGGVVLLQTGGLLNTKAMTPDLSRLSPRRGLSRIFGASGLIEAVKALAKACAFAWAVWQAAKGVLPGAWSAASWQLGTLIDRMSRELFHVLLLMLGCQAAIALLDVAWTRYQFTRRLRMTGEEIKQEYKDAEGDPRLKARLKQVRKAKARQRMMSKVAQATVVITNPTHFAVALAYDRGSHAAPRIVAKGMDDVAARIREAAARHGVPLVANPPLARSLHALPLDSEVPPEHFKAVAEVIAYVWRLSSQIGRSSPVA